MSNLKKDTIEMLKNDFYFDELKLVTKQEDELVKKYLFELFDGQRIESVLMYHDYGISICVSSQVGCNMGCKFCESGRRKKVRNLEAYEMVLQILMIEKELGERISHVVVMGIGEPFENYDNLTQFIDWLCESILGDTQIIDFKSKPKLFSAGRCTQDIKSSIIIPRTIQQ